MNRPNWQHNSAKIRRQRALAKVSLRLVSNPLNHSTQTSSMSNLSKIKPKLRTEGRVTGNWGRNKVRAGSSLNEIGLTDKENISVTTQDEYLKRMYNVL